MVVYHSPSVSTDRPLAFDDQGSASEFVTVVRPSVTSWVTTLFDQADLTADLHAVEQLLIERTHSRSDLISRASAHSIRSGGKRLRAAQPSSPHAWVTITYRTLSTRPLRSN